jgi:uncharacterized protein (TIGR02996 family)
VYDDILAAPDDDGPRLAYAGRCAERGDEARAEMIRLQCAVAAMDAADPQRMPMWDKSQKLLKENFGRWFDPVAAVSTPTDVWRGFVSSARGAVEELVPYADRLDEVAPTLTLNVEPSEKTAFPAHRVFSRVRHLDFDEYATEDGALAGILASPGLTGLRTVSLYDDEQAKESVEAIDAHLPDTVTTLNFVGFMSTTFTDKVAAQLSRSPRVSQLRHLVLYNCNVLEAGAQALAHGGFQALETLRLGIGQYSRNIVGPMGAAAIANGSAMQYLTELDLDFNDITDDGVSALASGTSLQFLEELHLQANGITDKGLAALCDSPLLHQLTLLDLSHNAITDKGLDRLLKAAPKNLRRLWLYHNPIGDKGAKILATSSWVGRLSELNIRNIQLTDTGLNAVADARNLRVIPRIGWDLHKASPKTLQRLADAMGDRVPIEATYPF